MIKELISDYERRINTIQKELNELALDDALISEQHWDEEVTRLKIKSGNYRTFISELNRIVRDAETPKINEDLKPKKLIRSKIVEVLKEGESEEVSDIKESNKLYALKVQEELAEIQDAEHKDIMEFVDLIDVAYAFARVNGFTRDFIEFGSIDKMLKKGGFDKLALNNLNPSNPSNKLYFK